MAAKTRLIIGAWTTAGGIAGVVCVNRIRQFEERTPCVKNAIRSVVSSGAARSIIGSGNLSLPWWAKSSNVDLHRGYASADFRVVGDSGFVQVLMTSKRQAKVQETMEENLDDEDVSLFEYYWLKPWELKRAFVNSFKALRQEKADADSDVNKWDVDSLLILPNGDGHKPIVLQGDPYAVPHYEALCLRRDATSKDDASRRRLYWAIGLSAAAAGLAGFIRLFKSMRLSQSYGFVSRSLLSHTAVTRVMGLESSVQSSSGTFTANYINGRLRLVNSAGSVADVDVTASRETAGRSNTWRILLARMRHGGLVYELDKKQFQG